MTHINFFTNLTMSPQIDDFLKKPPLLNLSSYCSGSVSVTIRIIKQKTQSDKSLGLTWLWSSVGCQRRLIWSCSEFKQWHYHRPSSTIGFLRNSEICLTCRDLLQMFFKAMPKVSNIFHIFRKDRSLKRNKKRTRNG